MKNPKRQSVLLFYHIFDGHLLSFAHNCWAQEVLVSTRSGSKMDHELLGHSWSFLVIPGLYPRIPQLWSSLFGAAMRSLAPVDEFLQEHAACLSVVDAKNRGPVQLRKKSSCHSKAQPHLMTASNLQTFSSSLSGTTPQSCSCLVQCRILH